MKTNLKDILFKTIIVSASFTLFSYLKTKKLYISEFNDYYYDRFLEEVLWPLSVFLGQNFYIRDFVMMLGALMLDASFIIFALLCIYHGRGWKEIITFASFYGFRGFFLNIFEFNIPENVLSEQPGIFSVMTPFGRASDFFYSGHTGCAFIIALFLYEYGHYSLFKLGIIVTLLQAIVMMLTRVHFLIDIIFGFCFAHYFKMISHSFAKRVDYILPRFGKTIY